MMHFYKDSLCQKARKSLKQSPFGPCRISPAFHPLTRYTRYKPSLNISPALLFCPGRENFTVPNDTSRTYIPFSFRSFDLNTSCPCLLPMARK